jgi:hypothetical protein
MSKHNKPLLDTPVEEKPCSACVHWKQNICEDKDGNPIKREAKLAPEFWYYETCAKNWGLPANAYLNGTKCKFWRTK